MLLVATLAAYSLGRMRWPRWAVHLILLWAVVFHMLPPITLVGAWFTMLRTVGLDSSYTGLILAHITLNLPIALWMMVIYILRHPDRTGRSGADRGRRHADSVVAYDYSAGATGPRRNSDPSVRLQLERVRGVTQSQRQNGHAMVPVAIAKLRPGIRDQAHRDGCRRQYCP